MASPLEMECPGCEESLKIPPAVFGKKIKCKLCGHAFVVPDPAVKASKSNKPAKPGKPGAKKEDGSRPPPPPPPEAKKPVAWDEDSAQDVSMIEEEDVPLCPYCAKELDPPDAKVCLHCGFNNLTRAKAETKHVWEPDVMDWFTHLLPGIVTVIIIIAVIVVNVICIMNMRDWLTGSFLDSEEKDASGRNKFYVAPGAFIFLIIFISLPIVVPCATFSYRRSGQGLPAARESAKRGVKMLPLLDMRLQLATSPRPERRWRSRWYAGTLYECALFGDLYSKWRFRRWGQPRAL